MRPIKVKKIGVICGCFKKLAIIPNLPKGMLGMREKQAREKGVREKAEKHLISLAWRMKEIGTTDKNWLGSTYFPISSL
jgi:hypothetical protein